jgi:hypothetical protein
MGTTGLPRHLKSSDFDVRGIYCGQQLFKFGHCEITAIAFGSKIIDDQIILSLEVGKERPRSFVRRSVEVELDSPPGLSFLC